MYNSFQDPNTGRIKEVKVGYSWTVLFWGLIPMLCRKDWISALVSFAIAWGLNMLIPNIFGCIFPSSIFYAIVAYFYNDYYAKKLLAKGYIQIN